MPILSIFFKMNLVEDTSRAACRDYIKHRLLKLAPRLHKYRKEKMQLLNLFERTVKNGESNSALVIGPRLCGKSALVKNVLSELNQQKQFQESAVVVYLNGLIHTDDSVSLKAIACQMNLSNVFEGRTFGSLAENLSFFLDCLKTGNREKTKSTIMILEEFDLFCCRSRQTLLYNLFDVAQSAEAPLCVLGMTCRLDVVELLEKRVKSRFSNRQIYLFPESEKSGLQELMCHCQELLSLPHCSGNLKLEPTVVHAWNNEVESLCKSSELRGLIKYLNHINISEKHLCRYLVLVVSRLNMNHKSLSLTDFNEVFNLMLQDGKCKILESLSVLELCLVIAMKQHSEIYDEEPFNFEMLLRMYFKFINQNSLDYTTDRSVIMKAFENIVNLELIIPVKSTIHSNLKEYQMYRIVLLPNEIMAGIENYQNLPTEVKQWAKNSII